MSDLLPFGEKRMTVKEVADALGVSRDLVEKRIRELMPDRMKQGETTCLTEAEVTAIKMRIEQNSSLATSDDRRKLADMPKTVLEKQLLIRQAMALQDEMIAELQSQLALAAPKVESFEALQRSERTMSITAAAKHFGLHPKTQVFPYLRDMKYLTVRDLPTQAAIDADYLSLREAECGDGEFRPQAVVLACQLETWRTRVVPQIKAWEIRP